MIKENKTRDVKELLQIMLDNFDMYFVKGLCYIAMGLHRDDIIRTSEYNILIKYILNNKPGEPYTSICYYWPAGNKKPRIEWLNEQIFKLTVSECMSKKED